MYKVALFLLFILPIIVLPLGYSYFETPKVFLAESLIQLLFLWFIYKYGPKTFLKVDRVFLTLSLILGLIALNSALFGNIFRLQGSLLLWHLIVLGLISSLIKPNLKQTFKVALISLIFLLITTTLYGTNPALRVVGSLGEPNSLAAVAVFIFPFVYFGFGKKVWALAFVAVLAIVFLSGSRSGAIALGIETLFIILSSIRKLSLVKSGFICLGLVGLSYFTPFWESRLRPADSLTQFKFEDRAEIWHTATVAFSKSPIWGHGFGNIQQALKEASMEVGNKVQYQVVDSSHNIFLDYLVGGGIIAFMLLSTLVISSFKGLLESWAMAESAAFLGLVTALSFNPLSVVVLAQLWWLIGQGFHSRTHSRT